MAYKSKNYEMDMCTGSLVGKMLLFTVPLIATGLLQLLFNTADMIVAGKFAGPTALASVSGTASLTNLIVNLFIGLSVGANVCVAKFYAQNNDEEVSETVHTAVVISVLFGIILAVFGFFMARPPAFPFRSPARPAIRSPPRARCPGHFGSPGREWPAPSAPPPPARRPPASGQIPVNRPR